MSILPLLLFGSPLIISSSFLKSSIGLQDTMSHVRVPGNTKCNKEKPQRQRGKTLLVLKVGQILVTHDKKFNSLSKVQIERAQISVW